MQIILVVSYLLNQGILANNILCIEDQSWWGFGEKNRVDFSNTFNFLSILVCLECFKKPAERCCTSKSRLNLAQEPIFRGIYLPILHESYIITYLLKVMPFVWGQVARLGLQKSLGQSILQSHEFVYHLDIQISHFKGIFTQSIS